MGINAACMSELTPCLVSFEDNLQRVLRVTLRFTKRLTESLATVPLATSAVPLGVQS